MAELSVLTIDGVSMDNTLLTAGDNIVIEDDVISLKSSPSLEGTPTAPTNGTATTANTQIATTGFVQNAINRRLPKSQVFLSQTTQSIANNKEVAINTKYTAPSDGTLICTVGGAFAANSAGIRFIGIQEDNTTIAGCYIRVVASTAGVTNMALPYVGRLTSGKTVTACVLQTSGSALNFQNFRLRGYFIPD